MRATFTKEKKRRQITAAVCINGYYLRFYLTEVQLLPEVNRLDEVVMTELVGDM